MRDHCESNEIWAETTRILRSHIFDCDLQIKGPGTKINIGPLTNMPRFLQKLEHCSDKNAEKKKPFETIQEKNERVRS